MPVAEHSSARAQALCWPSAPSRASYPSSARCARIRSQAAVSVRGDAAPRADRARPNVTTAAMTSLIISSDVLVQRLDINGQPTTEPPAIVRFSNVVGHFSTWAVVIVSGGAPPRDTTPPAITISASPTMLWPPTGRLVPVTVTGTITDAQSGAKATSARYAVTDEYGLVQPSGPVSVSSDGRYAFAISLQASRHGSDPDGRKYTITVSARDNAGNAGSASTTVTVPHDQGTR